MANMIDISGKETTQRRAVASGILLMGAEAFRLLRAKQLPKGDPLPLAEAAGVLAAKRTAELIPLCHPLALDHVGLAFEFVDERCSLRITATASTSAKTGVEMEALAAVNVALLTVYDLVKGVDPALEITEVMLCEKTGGKSGHWKNPRWKNDCSQSTKTANLRLGGVPVAIITVSDRASQGASADTAGPAIADRCKNAGAEVVARSVVPDDNKLIIAAIKDAVQSHRPKLVFTVGGTGLGPRDITPEAVESMCERVIPGFGERMRHAGSRQTERAYLSRQTAGIYEGTIIVALPGSERGACESLDAVLELLPHALAIAGGAMH